MNIKSVVIWGLIIGFVFGIISVSYIKNVIGQKPIPTEMPMATPLVPKAGIPKQIIIDALSVNAQLESVSLDVNGRMAIPSNYNNAAWYQLGVRPGETGNAVIAGHLDTPTGGSSIFYNIDKLSKGNLITVIDENGQLWNFAVAGVAEYEDDSFPLEIVFGPTEKSRLNLITCSGTWDPLTKNYSKRVVVFADLIN